MGMVKMKHVNIYGPGKDAKPTLEMLAKAECFQPDEINDASKAAATTQENLFAPLLTQTIGLIKDLGADANFSNAVKQKFIYTKIKRTVEGFAGMVAERRTRKAEIDARLSTYEQTKNQLYHLTNLHTNVDEIFACKYLKVRFGRLPKDSFIKLPYYADKPFTFNEYDFDGEYYWGVYFVPETHSEEVDAIFASLYFERMWVPDFVHGTPQDALAELLEQQSMLEAERKELEDMTAIASLGEIEELRSMAAWLNHESQIFDMRKYVVVLEHSHYISGYTPEKDIGKLNEALNEVEGLKVLEDDPNAKAPKGSKPPVELKNNKFARPFQMFVEMYGLPGYGDLDPTMFVALTYAVLFGAMFGDIGQGLVLGLVGYFIMYKKMNMGIGLILTRCSVFSVIFGFVYGSVFGFEHIMEELYHGLGITALPLAVMDASNINTILIASIAAGVFIIAAAIITGIVSNFRKKIYAKTIFSVNGLAGLVFYVAIILAVAQVALGLKLPFVDTIPYFIICLILPFISIYFAEPICELIGGHKPKEGIGEILTNGFFEMFDALLSFASNTMSFLRVGGFVLAHAGMMSVVHTLASMTTSVGVQVVIYILGNIFVMGIEGLFVAIQVLRLEFYEVFSRFFEADGKPFEPLKIQVAEDL